MRLVAVSDSGESPGDGCADALLEQRRYGGAFGFAPFMRALFMDFPNDPKVFDIGDQYMFGPAFRWRP